MTHSEFDEFAHDTHMRKAIGLAREAADRGDEPFGSILVRNDVTIMEESNRVITTNDIRRHPELHLAYRAYCEYDAEERAQMVMYTSTEPCSMCAGGMTKAGFGCVVYSVGTDELAEFRGTKPAVRSSEILDDVSDVVGPFLNEEGRQVHQDNTV